MSKPPLPQVEWRDNYHWFTHETLLAKACKTGYKLVLPLLTQIERVGFENFPQQGPCVITCNHISNFDPLFVGVYLPRYPHFMAKVNLYRNRIIRWFFRAGGSFPVYRGQKDRWAFEQAGRVLAAGEVLFMFPEGTRSKHKAQLQRGKIGAVKFAIEHQAKIVPMAIIGTQNIRPGIRVHNKVRMEIAPPLEVEQLAKHSPPYDYETLRYLTDCLMQQIAAMLPPENRGVYR